VTETLGGVLVWLAFFATSVYGHAALKLAVDSNPATLRAALSWWGATAFLAWTASGVLWMLVLRKHSLFDASTISSLRYVAICITAWIVWKGELDVRSLAGAVLITAGVCLVAR